ncbi:anti-sigma factor antagonist [Mycolicibacter longobardus]|uniref:anti-sigma factor antagonist n=1 Tax=Mycolicibacter longobardus TaxID=1108812 RepID=UPI000A151D08|nr:anti-sigma factor antagonist [Mycolicibacter longobardus]
MLFGLRRKLRRCAARRDNAAAPGQAGKDAGGPVTTGDRPVRLGDGPGLPDDGLRVVLERSGAALLVHAGGSVDASNVMVWRRLVGEAAGVTTAPGPLIIETNGLEFMGVCAFAVLVEESARCRSRGITLCLVSGQPIVARVVTAAGLHAELSFFADLDEALGGSPREDPEQLNSR